MQYIAKPAAQLASSASKGSGLLSVTRSFMIAGGATTAQQLSTRMAVNAAGRLAVNGAVAGVGASSISTLGAGSLTVVGTLMPLRAGANMPEETGGKETYYTKKYVEQLTDPSGATDAYLREVQKRFLEGTATTNDYRYKEEIIKRGIGNGELGGGLKALGLGSTGRIIPKNLVEQMAMKQIVANPYLGTRIMEGMKDSRWLGWTKMEYKIKTSNGVNAVIHYLAKWDNGLLRAVDDFKFK